jgi:hypothetical protein
VAALGAGGATLEVDPPQAARSAARVKARCGRRMEPRSG